MIGNTLVKYLSSKRIRVVEINREGFGTSPGNPVFKFDVVGNTASNLLQFIKPESTIINFVGLIRHKIDLHDEQSLLEASKVNSIFPIDLAKLSGATGCRLIQIGTDCVYSGSRGGYSESSVPDPVDFYGQSKLAGEIEASHVLTLRVSVIGHELTKHIELLDWVLRQPSHSKINGFENHIWNGVTALSFARILEAEIFDPIYNSGTFHIVPQDVVDKYQLIKEIARIWGRKDLNIERFSDSRSVNRTLQTNFHAKNREIWNKSGYPSIPSISMMLQEYFNWDQALARGK